MSHACRGIGAFAHAIISNSRNVLNRTTSATAAALLLATAAPDVALAQSGVTKAEAPFSNTELDACTGETVLVTGTADLYMYEKEKKTGEREFTVRIKQRGTGVSLTDPTVTYTFHGEETQKFGDFPQGSLELVQLTKTMLIRNGDTNEASSGDFVMKHRVRIIINDDGTTTMIRDQVPQACTDLQ